MGETCSRWRAKWPVICSEWWSCSKCWQKISEIRRFKMSECSCKFPQISRTVLYESITVRLPYHKSCARWVPKMLTCAHKTQTSSALTLSERYRKHGSEFLNRIVRVTADEIWVSFVNVQTKLQPKKPMHTHLPNKSKKFKYTLSARKLIAAVFWNRKGVLIVEFMHQGTTITSEVYCEALQNWLEPFRIRDVECWQSV
jgi:hypothetical protein